MQLNEVTRKAGFEKGWEKGKKRGAGNALLFPFSFQISLPPPPPLLPLPFFVPATQAISKLARPRGPSTGTPTSVYDCRHYSHGIGDVSQA